MGTVEGLLLETEEKQIHGRLYTELCSPQSPVMQS